MNMAMIVTALGTSALTALGLAASVVTPANAALSSDPDRFDVCSPACGAGEAGGFIYWNNRTATVSGHVTDHGDGNTTAIFEAFAGSTKIASTTRTANDQSSLGSYREYEFVIGDSSLVGGIDRIKITVCWDYGTVEQNCGRYENYSKA